MALLPVGLHAANPVRGMGAALGRFAEDGSRLRRTRGLIAQAVNAWPSEWLPETDVTLSRDVSLAREAVSCHYSPCELRSR